MRDHDGRLAMVHRLVSPMPADGWWGWAGPLFVTLLGGALRFLRLGEPHAVVFDETHYIKGAYAVLRFGVERMTLDTDKDPVANRMIMAGDLDIWRRCPAVEERAEYVAHPPLGKWMSEPWQWRCCNAPSPFTT